MRCPTLSELPSPPDGKTGWPWTETGPLPLDRMTGGSPWPQVSVVTPSYNQGLFIEETIRSVLLQGYPELEYIIIDGGSTDESVQVIRKYEPWLAHWVSERDSGQSEALNKGFARATGPFVAWLNSDDLFLPGALARGVTALHANPTAVLAYGDCDIVDEAGAILSSWHTGPCSLRDLLLEGNRIPQPTVVMRLDALRAAGGLVSQLHYVMDHALWAHLGLQGEFVYQPGTAARFRQHQASKSVADGSRFLLEWLQWLTAWSPLGQILTVAERAELVRRLQLRIAVAHLFTGQAEAAAPHFQAALATEWPYGTLEKAADYLINATSLDGQQINDCPDYFPRLRKALQYAGLGTRAQKLYRQSFSRRHFQALYMAYRSHQWQTVRRHLWPGLWYDPGWLRNRGVWSIILRAYCPPFRR